VSAPIKTTKLKSQPIAAVRLTAEPTRIGESLRQVLPVVASYLDGIGSSPAGPPLARYFDYTEDEAEFEAGFPVAEPVAGEGRVVAGELPGGLAATTTYDGPYGGLGRVHDAIGEWVLANGHDPSGAAWEVYVVGPPEQQDPSRFRTEVFWPLRK
jgi:effector-binding domain-containing protein